MPSLRPALTARRSRAYRRTVLGASSETDLPESTFPSSSPFTLDQILDRDFLPE
jgi:hypothetical protein